MRLDLLKPCGSDQVIQKQSNQSYHHNLHARTHEFDIGQAVMIRNFWGQPKCLPGEIVQKNGPLSYLVNTQTGLSWKRHVDHLKERLDISGRSEDSYAESNPFVHLPVPQPTEQAHVPEATQSPQRATFADRYPTRARHPPECYGSDTSNN